jgi:hypothetical protein
MRKSILERLPLSPTGRRSRQDTSLPPPMFDPSSVERGQNPSFFSLPYGEGSVAFEVNGVRARLVPATFQNSRI